MKEGFCDKKIEFNYFDYAATTFMPESVFKRQNQYNRNINVSANRGKSILSKMADAEYSEARRVIKGFFCGSEDKQMILYRNATQAINEIARSIEEQIRPMDIILLGPYEHHSNYLPWRELAKRRQAILFEMPIMLDGRIDLDYLKEISDRIKIIAFSSVANVNGFQLSISQLKPILTDEAIIIVDDSQKCAHEHLEQDPRIDCHVVNSHKMYGPKGIAGALVSERLLSIMVPCMYGGGMVERIGFPNEWKKGTESFHYGTFDISAVVGWEAACRFIEQIGFDKIQKEEKRYHDRVLKLLRVKKGITVISSPETFSMISFYHHDFHAHDLEDLFSDAGIVLRSGHLCSQNTVAKYNMKPVVRISFGYSTDEEDIEKLLGVINSTL